MNTYQMSIEHYTGSLVYFLIEAENKTDAVEKGINYAKKCGRFSGGNYYFKTIKCVKKINPKKKVSDT